MVVGFLLLLSTLNLIVINGVYTIPQLFIGFLIFTLLSLLSYQGYTVFEKNTKVIQVVMNGEFQWRCIPVPGGCFSS